MRHTPLFSKAAAPCLAALLAGLWLLPAFAQEPLSRPGPATLPEARPLSVPFVHNEHNKKAQVANCATCHHPFPRSGNRAAGQPTVERRCSECHQERPSPNDRAPGLMLAYHKLCQDCHKAQAKGPVTCSGCHKK